MSPTPTNEVSQLIATLQTIEQALTNPDGVAPVSAQTISELQAGITNLQQLAEAEKIKFDCIHGAFISRDAARPLAKEYKQWANDSFRAGPMKNMRSLYVHTSLMHELLGRTNIPHDFIEISLGKQGNKICILLAAVDANGNRLDDLTKESGGGNDLIDESGPCPQPPCPSGLDQ